MNSKTQNFYDYIFFTACGAVLLYLGLTSHIGTSEFWPMSLSKGIIFFDFSEISLLYKPVFYLFCSIPHLYKFDNWQHVLVTRLLFSLLGWSSVVIIYHWLREQIPRNRDGQLALAALVFFSTPLFATQVIKIRSDNLALFFAALLLALSTKRLETWSTKRTIGIALVHILMLGCTPRAIFISSFISLFCFYNNSLKITELLGNKKFIGGILGPYLIALVLAITVFLFYLPLQLYAKTSYLSSGFHFEHLEKFFISDSFFIILLIASVIFIRRKSLFILGGGAVISILGADLKTPFLISSLLPFVFIPSMTGYVEVLSFPKFKLLKIFFLGWLLLIASQRFLLDYQAAWEKPSLGQRHIIRSLDSFLKLNPELIVFDGVGILPRSKQVLAYLGPNDELAIGWATQQLLSKKPDLILTSGRTLALGKDLTDLLAKSYHPIAPGLYIKNEVSFRDIDLWYSEIPTLEFGT